MRKYPELAKALRDWWKTQGRWPSRSSFAESTGVGLATLQSYFDGRYWPRGSNRISLFKATALPLFKSEPQKQGRNARRGLPSHVPLTDQLAARKLRYGIASLLRLEAEIARTVAALAPVTDTFGSRLQGRDWHAMAQTVVALMDALERRLKPFLDDPEALHVLRAQISGPDAGYLSGLLSSLLDDDRLARWKEMTTYRYGTR